MKVHPIISSAEFKAFVKKRWTFSIIMSMVILAAYFGFILIVAFNKELFAVKIAPSLSWGIVCGLGLIILAWVMTGIYVNWANNVYDKDVEMLKGRL